MQRLLALSALAVAALAPASLAHAASAPASATSKVTYVNTEEHSDIAGGAVGSVPGVVAVITSSGYCSGAVIAPRVVLTAAHCLDGVSNPASIRVHLDHSHQDLGVSRYFTAPGFNPATHVDDAAVLILSSPSKEPALRVATAEPPAGTGAMITGYGQQTYTSAATTIAYSGETIIQSFAACQAAWAAYGSAVPRSDICAENAPYYNDTVTRGDSGGPLLIKSRIGHWRIAGINDLVVIPNDVYNGAIPQAFGRVSMIRPWLESEIAHFG